MTLTMQRRIAARVLDVGENKVWFNPIMINEIKEAITKNDIVDLIRDGAIVAKPNTGRRKVERRKRKGTGKTKMRIRKRKEKYIHKIRNLTKFIKLLHEKLIIDKNELKRLRLLSKSGHFKSQRHLKEHIVNVMKKDVSKLEAEK